MLALVAHCQHHHASPARVLCAMLFVIVPVAAVHAFYMWREWRAEVRRTRAAMDAANAWLSEHDDHTVNRVAFR